MKKFLFSDIDGTLVINQGISNEDVEAIRRFRAAGHQFILCTGRNPLGTQLFLDSHEDLECDGAVLAGGAGIYRTDESFKLQLVEQKMIAKETTWEIISYIHDNSPRTAVHWSDGLRRLMLVDRRIDIPKSPTPHLISFDDWKAENQDALVILLTNMDGDTDAIQLVQKDVLKRWGNLIEAHVNKTSVDISVKGANKGGGIRRAMELFGSSNHYFGIGDGFNDLPMFEALGKEQSFFISSGEKELQEYAGTTVDSVAKCIELLMSDAYHA
ncbi:MAG: HAD-IIB family hydrolase, partial [Brevinema sp.]